MHDNFPHFQHPFSGIYIFQEPTHTYLKKEDLLRKLRVKNKKCLRIREKDIPDISHTEGIEFHFCKGTTIIQKMSSQFKQNQIIMLLAWVPFKNISYCISQWKFLLILQLLIFNKLQMLFKQDSARTTPRHRQALQLPAEATYFADAPVNGDKLFQLDQLSCDLPAKERSLALQGTTHRPDCLSLWQSNCYPSTADSRSLPKGFPEPFTVPPGLRRADHHLSFLLHLFSPLSPTGTEPVLRGMVHTTCWELLLLLEERGEGFVDGK